MTTAVLEQGYHPQTFRPITYPLTSDDVSLMFDTLKSRIRDSLVDKFKNLQDQFKNNNSQPSESIIKNILSLDNIHVQFADICAEFPELEHEDNPLYHFFRCFPAINVCKSLLCESQNPDLDLTRLVAITALCNIENLKQNDADSFHSVVQSWSRMTAKLRNSNTSAGSLQSVSVQMNNNNNNNNNNNSSSSSSRSRSNMRLVSTPELTSISQLIDNLSNDPNAINSSDNKRRLFLLFETYEQELIHQYYSFMRTHVIGKALNHSMPGTQLDLLLGESPF